MRPAACFLETLLLSCAQECSELAIKTPILGSMMFYFYFFPILKFSFGFYFFYLHNIFFFLLSLF
jgi:hypothetical protein